MEYLLLLTFLLAPTYAIRFNLFRLPTDVLMVWIFLFWLIFAGWLIAKKQIPGFLSSIKNVDKKLLTLAGLFFIAGIIGLFIGGVSRANLGQFVVLFLQPISLFFIASFIFQQSPKSKPYLLSTIYFILALAGIIAAIQYFTLFGLPPAWWGNSVEPKRALSFFVHPNFYALWCAPLLALLIPDLMQKVRDWKLEIGNWKFAVAWLLGALGLLLSLSRSGWLGLAAAVGVYLIVAADRKTRKIILSGVIVMVIVVIYYPNLRWRVLLPFYGEKSAGSRIELWNDGFKAIKQSPVFGLSLTGFAKEYSTLNTDPTLDTHNFPHNIFLDLWVETGLIGLISMTGLIGLYIYQGLRGALSPFGGDTPTDVGAERVQVSDREAERLNYDQLTKLAVALFLIAIIFQGLVDNPYFKNDLAMVFWIILALV